MEDPGREEWYAREIRAKQLLAITIPDYILESLGPKMLFKNGAHYFFSQLAYFIYSLTTTVNDHMHTQCAANDKVCTSDGVRNRSGTQGKGSLSKKTERRMGKKGEMPRGRIDEAGAATGPGMKTTDHKWTDGVSLATPASGPRLVTPPPSPSVESTTPPARTPPHANKSHGEGQQAVGDDDNIHQVHEHINNPVNGADTSTDETAASVTAGASTDTAAPHTDQAEATRDQGRPTKTNASALSASRDHQDAVMTDPTRPSEDPADVMGDDKRRPDAPTEPPDMPEGTRGRGSWEQAEMGVFEVARGGERGLGDDSNKDRRPGTSDEAEVEPRGPTDVEVEPGGSTVHENADAVVEGEAAEDVRQDAQVDGKTQNRAEMRQSRWRGGVRVRIYDRRQKSKNMVSVPKRMSTTYLRIPQTHHHHSPAQTNPQIERTDPQASSSRGRGVHQRAAMSDLPAPRRTLREHQRMSWMMESGRGSRETRQNIGVSHQSQGEQVAHLWRLETSHTTQAVKRTHQETSRATYKAPEAAQTTTAAIRTRQVELQAQEGTWSCKGSREAPMSIGTAISLWTEPNMIGYVPAATGTRAASKCARYVDIPGQEVG
jgi:hypothetical protein